MLTLYKQPLSALILPSHQYVRYPLDLSPAAQYVVPRLVDRLVVATNDDLFPSLCTHHYLDERKVANNGMLEKPVAISVFSN